MHALRSVSVLQVPQGYERGGCGVPTLFEEQKEHDSVPASRSAAQFFEVGCAASRRVKTTCFVWKVLCLSG